MVDYGVLVTIMVSATLAAILMPWFISKMNAKGVQVRDRHKSGKPLVATNAGVLIILAVLITIISLSMAFRLVNRLQGDDFFPRIPSEIDNAILIVLLIYAFFGFVDDFIDVSQTAKIVFPIILSYPMVLVMSSWNPWVPFCGTIDLNSFSINISGFGNITGGTFLIYIIVPVYIMVVANLKNMHSGFNGLQSGTALIVLITILLKSWYDNNLDNIYTAAALAGALLVFVWYNRYPSRAFEGNIGSMAVGGALGAVIISQHYIWAGMVMLLPHIANFLLYVYWRVQHRTHPKNPRYAKAKYSNIREDGTLEVPNPYTLKWVLPYYYRLNEKQATMAMWAVTAVFCVLGFFVPG